MLLPNWKAVGLWGFVLAAPLVLLADDKPAPKDPPGPPPAEKPADGKGPEELFRELDKNNDGKLTSDEIGPDHRRHFDHLLREAGKTEAGVLTKEEFLNALKPGERKIRGMNDFGGRGDRRGPGNFDPGQMFDRWDRNGDGKLTLDEVPEPARDRLRPVFEKLKKDSLTREEFLSNRGQLGQGFNPGDFFKRLDRNGDGRLSLDEVPDRMRERFPQALKQAGKKEGESLSLEEFQRFMARGPGGREGGQQIGNPEEFLKKNDKNGDGKVTLEEVDGRLRQLFERLQQRLNKDPDDGLTLDDLKKAQQMEVARGDQRRPGDGDMKRREGNPDGQRPERRRLDGEPRRPPGFPRESPALKLLDTNNDGKISKEEWSRLSEAFDKLDTNHDGALDPFELMGPPPERRRMGPAGEGMEGPEGDKPRPDAKADAGGPEPGAPKGKGGGGRFDRLDVDQDRKLSKAEARGPLLKNFDKFDTNNDGFLDRAEIRKGRQELGVGGPGKKPADGDKKPDPESDSK